MLWLALHFRHLPLEIFSRSSPETAPLAVVSSPAQDAVVVASDRKSAKLGVRCGMKVSAAWALVPDLRIVVRDEAAEHASLQWVAAWALQFTSVSSIAEPTDVLLEVEGSLKLFDGLLNLCRRIRSGLADLGYTVSTACAPTPFAAQLFARAGLETHIQHYDSLHRTLEELPLSRLGCAPETLAALGSFGIRTLGGCLQLPRAGLARRIGRRFLDDLDRALGKLPDPRPPFVPPPTFDSMLPLPAPVEQAAALLFAGRRLLAELCGFMAATARGAQHLHFVFAHEKRGSTRTAIRLVAASRDLDHLTVVLREHLVRLELPCPATAIKLTVDRFSPLAACSLSFLPDVHDHAATAAKMIEQMRARLGERAVCGLALRPDYRPEYSWQTCEPGKAAACTIPATYPARPLWLLDPPRRLREAASSPCCDGALSLVSGPERIETGWWDGRHVARDYFVARNPAQSLLWVYRERNAEGGWYLHGIFA